MDYPFSVFRIFSEVMLVNDFNIIMQSIKKSECPKELEPADRRSSVHVNLIRRNENCPVSSLLMIYCLFFFEHLRFKWIVLLQILEAIMNN